MATRRRGPSREWKVNIPIELALNIELLFYNPARRKFDYAARSILVTNLLRAYWDSLPEARKQEALGTRNNQGVVAVAKDPIT